MAPTTRAAKQAALADQQRETHAPSLPLEVWHLIFLQTTNPKQLWTTGRQVCSTWRSEIPKAITKKYLEDLQMTQIHSDSETTEVEDLTCLMGSKLIFSHYDPGDKARAVFKQYPEEWRSGHEHFCKGTREKAGEKKSRSLDDFHISAGLSDEGKCSFCFGSSESRRCDVPPYSIRVKCEANDTELPDLEVDFARREISFEWQGMLEEYFREAAILDRRYHDITTESLQWLDREKPSISKIMLRAWKDDDARMECRKEVRQNRIKRRDDEIRHASHSGTFDTEIESKILEGFQELEAPKDADPTENEEEKQTWSL